MCLSKCEQRPFIQKDFKNHVGLYLLVRISCWKHSVDFDALSKYRRIFRWKTRFGVWRPSQNRRSQSFLILWWLFLAFCGVMQGCSLPDFPRVGVRNSGNPLLGFRGLYMSFYSFRKVGEVEHLDTTCLCCKNFSLTSTGGLQPLCHHWLTWLQRRGAGHIAIDDTWYVRLQITLIGLAFWRGSDFGPKCPHVPQTMAYGLSSLL